MSAKLNYLFTCMSLLLLCLSAFHPPASAKSRYKGRLVPGVWTQQWNDTLKQSVLDANLSAHNEPEINRICPGYYRSPKKKELFWRQLFVSLSWKESLHGPANYVVFNKGYNKGLFQINPVLRTAYGCGKVDLYNPLENISCATKMAAQLIAKFGSFLSGNKGGMAAYWQPLRATTKYNRTNRSFILNQVKLACQTNRIDYNSTERALTGYKDGEILASADLTANTLDDLGLSPDQLENDERDQTPQSEPNFTFDPSSGMLLDLTYRPAAATPVPPSFWDI